MHDSEEQIFEDEANPSLMVTPGAVYTDVPKDCELQQNTSPNDIKSSPSYAEITKKKPVDNSSSSDEDSIEKTSKKGRKSRKYVREEEAERLKMQGIHPTIEMSMGRSKRNRSQKGVTTPSLLNK